MRLEWEVEEEEKWEGSGGGEGMNLHVHMHIHTLTQLKSKMTEEGDDKRGRHTGSEGEEEVVRKEVKNRMSG